jgi:hypothetical protein
MFDVSIPPSITLPRPPEWDVCEKTGYPNKIRIIPFTEGQLLISRKSCNSFYVKNADIVVVEHHSSCNVTLPFLFITSLPSQCVLTANPCLHSYNLYSNTNVISSNDSFPKITLFNPTNKTITLPSGHLTINCKIIIANYDHISFNI